MVSKPLIWLFTAKSASVTEPLAVTVGEPALNARLGPALAVGAAFDFLAGVKPQAPEWMQKSGTEWAFRLASEPRRLTKRYLWGNPRFLMAAAKRPGLRKVRP